MMQNRESVNVLLVGGGGREHALAWKLRQSPRLGNLFVTNPENPGLAALGKPVDVPMDIRAPFQFQRFCDKNNIGLVVIGPEEPLAAGLADILAAPGAGRAIFGPGAAGARLEADKAWAKQLMRAASVPMADGRTFTDPAAAKMYIETREDPPVVKASGLAKGKGVIVPQSTAEAIDAIDRIMIKREFGEAGRTVVVEERLEGHEASVLALVDGRTIYVLEACQDHKRLGENDTGPNTGGMGVYCPGGITDDATIAQVQSEVLVPTLDALRRDGIDFRGVLYAGLMITPSGPKVLEFNARFGDPECQALMARFDADLLEVLLATATRRLDEVEINWKPAASCCIVIAAEGYPVKPRTGVPIEGIDAAAAVPGVQVFHAGTKRDASGAIVSAGGRVLNVVGTGDSMGEARRLAYQAADLIRFPGKVMRRDIGAKAPALAGQ
ncbi:MAG: phosphoribosylamine--glycine ligase [Phycisphaeraceae bacterium]|nr:phosphoribosylamine--glycine ligase [Phycisphaeraceae bacterium]